MRQWREENLHIPTFEQWQAFSIYEKLHPPLAPFDLNDEMRCRSMPMRWEYSSSLDPWQDRTYVRLWGKFRLRCYKAGCLHPDGKLCASVMSEEETSLRNEVAGNACRAVGTSEAAYMSQDPVLMQTIFSAALDAACNVSPFCVEKVACDTALNVVHEFDAIQAN